ncbi:hypothetical protein CMV_000004 [Castanea mollissima]|uniref:Resistance protein n=1 Tax=Castanea mollissima TaxID=60419 RepID=A0A8J4W5L6_9ROSI|nr:hypothetical protein CMV_000004 [Castanea mollissima]
MVEAIVSGAVDRIVNLIRTEVKFLSGVSENVKLLQTELRLMQSLVKDADARQDESATVRQLVAEIRELVYDAEDIIEAYALKVASRRQGGMQNMLKGCSFILDEGITVHKVGLDIECIMTKISNLTTRYLNCGVMQSQGGGTSSSNERERERRQTFSHLEHDVVGLLSPSAEERDEIRKLLNDEIIEKLHQVQREKKCLVILDDIWTTNDWKKICEGFPVKKTGSKILLTSRNRDVALQADPRGLHLELTSLNEEKSWELFEKIAISWRIEITPDCESSNPQGNASSSSYKEITPDCESSNPQENASSSSYKGRPSKYIGLWAMLEDKQKPEDDQRDC